MIREGLIRWNAAAEIISIIRPTKRKREKERKTQNDARAAKKERRRGSEKKNSLSLSLSGGGGGGGRWKKRAEKKPSSHRANEPIFSHLARPDGWTDAQVRREGEREDAREAEEKACNEFRAT